MEEAADEEDCGEAAKDFSEVFVSTAFCKEADEELASGCKAGSTETGMDGIRSGSGLMESAVFRFAEAGFKAVVAEGKLCAVSVLEACFGLEVWLVS